MLNFIICDDNINILEKLEKILGEIFSKNNLDGRVSLKSSNFDEILDYVGNNLVDVILLDINFKSEKNGLDLAAKIRKKNKSAYLIFMTGHLEYALVAYKYNTFDYIAKPITYDRLEDSILRLYNDVSTASKNYLKIDSRNTLIEMSEIFYIKRDGMKLVFHTQSINYESYNSFTKIESFLPDNFVRAHKSYIVNIDKIKSIEPAINLITLTDNSTCEIGPKYKNELLEVIANHGNT